MAKYILKRVLHLILIMLGVTFITFALMHLAPSDPASVKLQNGGVGITEEMIQKTRHEMGLDKPFLVQYFTWLTNVLHGDLGNSYVDGMPVISKLGKAIPNTLILTAATMALTLVVSIPLGVLTAVRKNKFTDYFIRFLTFVGSALPNFFLSIALIYIFAIRLKLMPVISDISFKGLILPTVAMSVSWSAKFIRQIRAAVLEELNSRYVMGSRARGLSEWAILMRHILKNTMITVLTLIGLAIGTILAGTAVIETIFNWRGVGKLVIDAIGSRDYPIVQGFVIWTSFVYVVVNLLTDLSYQLIDPRVR
ncbi:MAG: nickel ABC transporter permease [Clostridiaceae bacterium]